MVARKFKVLLEPADEGGFVVKCLELPVASEGETKEEAQAKKCDFLIERASQTNKSSFQKV